MQPTRPAFAQSTPGDSSEPVIEELRPAPDAERVFRHLASLPHCIYFDSARHDSTLGRYSFVAADPFEFLRLAVDEPGGFARLAEQMQRWASRRVAELPPFQGGAAGLLSYDLGRQLEPVAAPAYDEFGVPALAIGFYDVVVAFDHQTEQAWLVSHGWPEVEAGRRHQRARSRLDEFRQWLRTPPPSTPARTLDAVLPEDLAPQYAIEGRPRLTSNFSRQQYLDVVARAIEYIRAGDVFQVNLSQRLLHPATDDSVSLYLRLRERNPATFGGYFDLGAFQILSASPERFLRVAGDQVEARPIKGTRRRTAWPESDLYRGDELLASEKDRAENVMIVDLLRNDLSRVCQADSVRVSDLCRLETYQFVQHLVSVVEGRLLPGRTALDLLAAAFPGGSITGAPKVRAMQLIAELEPTARGPYCGSLGYLGFDGTLDTNILIRTITAGRGWWQVPVGGGVVAQSVPVGEYEETWAKAGGLIDLFE